MLQQIISSLQKTVLYIIGMTLSGAYLVSINISNQLRLHIYNFQVAPHKPSHPGSQEQCGKLWTCWELIHATERLTNTFKNFYQYEIYP